MLEQIARGEAFQTLAQIGWGQDNPAFRQLFTSLAIPGGTHVEMEAFNELQRLSSSPENAALGLLAEQLVVGIGRHVPNSQNWRALPVRSQARRRMARRR